MAQITQIRKSRLLLVVVITLAVFVTFPRIFLKFKDRDPNFEYFYGPSRVPRISEEDFPIPQHDKKFFIYDCREPLCGGLGDRQEGIVAAYLLAQMMGRRFGVIMSIPCDIGKFVMENKDPWILPNGSLNGVSILTFKELDTAAWRIRESIHIGRLEDMFYKDAVLFNVNQEFVQYLKKLPRFQELKWARNRTVPEIYNVVLRRLFKFNPKYQHIYDNFQKSVRKEGKQLACAHIRLHVKEGAYKHNKATVTYVNQIWRFLQIYNDTSAYRIFVATNSEGLRNEAKTMFPDVIADVEGPIKHVDLEISDSDSCRGLGKSLLDQMILSSCDVLLISDSGFSRVAAMLRGTDENLFNLTGKLSYRDKNFIPPYW